MTKCVFVSKDNEWSNALYDRLISRNKDVSWLRIFNKNDLDKIADFNPDWAFFFHWSQIVSKDIWSKWKCVVLHTSNLPHGKGGSPIQNQILDNIVQTKVNAIEMTDKVDSGRIYCNQLITLQGTLRDIWMTIAIQSYGLIVRCIKENLNPEEQESEPSTKVYKRRRDNNLDLNCSLSQIYNQIRMLDGEGYPRSRIELGHFTIEFSRAGYDDNGDLICDAKFKKI